MFEARNGNAFRRALLRGLRTLPSWLLNYYQVHRFAVNGLVIIGVSAFFVRLLALIAYPAPPGADYGNYLTNLHAMLGRDVTGDGLQYPAVFVVYLWGLISVFGELTGLLLSGPLLGAMISIPSYALLRSFAKPPYALVGAAVLAFGEGISEMIGWGGNPNLLGMIFGTFFVAYLSKYLAKGKRLDLAAAAISFSLLSGSHQISLVVFSLAAILAAAVLALQTRDRRLLLRGLLALVGGVAASIPFVPFYVRFSTASSELLPTRPTILTLNDVLFLIGWFFRESLAFWIPLTIFAILGYARLRRTNPIAFSIGVGLLASPTVLAATIMALHPVRPIYFLPLGIVPGAIAYIQSAADRLRADRNLHETIVRSGTVPTAIVLAVAFILVSTAHQRMADAAAWYSVAKQDLLDVLQWIRDHTPMDSVVATSGPARYGEEALVGCTWGWWIEGYAERKSLCTENTQFLAWAEQVQRSTEANQAFAGVVSAENGRIRVGDYAPYGSRGNPLISGDFGVGYEPFVFFDDARVAVQWTKGVGQATSTDVPFFFPNRVVSYTGTTSFAHLGYNASSEGITIRRTVELARSSGEVWTNYTFSTQGTIDQVGVSVLGTSDSRLNNFDDVSKTLSIGPVPGFGERVGAEVRIENGADALNRTIFNTNPEAALQQVQFVFTPRAQTFLVSFSIEAANLASTPAEEVKIAEAYATFVASGVTHVLVDKTKVRDIEWFTNDRSEFEIVYQNFGVALFQVI